MYARYFTFKSRSGVRSEVEALADKVSAFMKSQQGFVSVHFLVSEDETEYGSFSLWESKQDAESGGASVRSEMREILDKLVVEPPTQEVFEVYEAKS